ncbi:MAG TPA: DUF5916 domain-containing protein [Polyangia bacterium]|nr:DUF5916 domain-containing protein [Polyangia bacterium]
MTPILIAPLLVLVAGAPQLQATRAADPPIIDGRLDEAVWKTAPATDAFTQESPFDGAPPSEHTSARVLYDDEALYVAFDCQQIHAPIIERLTRRDQDSESEWVSVQLDPRGDGKAALSFSVNVSGVLLDAIITEPTNWNTDWDENWEARAARTATGWSAEFRIPFRVLRFDGSLPVQSWGFQVGRYIAQNQEVDYWAYAPRATANPLAHFGRLENLRDLKRTGALELRPFVTAAGHRLDTTDDTTASGYSASWSAGLDLKWHLTQDLVLDGAIRPDFGQVEADQVILNLTNYETFLPEKRPLFIEGTEVFAFPLQIFYSRRIGIAPTYPTLRTDVTQQLVNVPEPATIYGAAKIVGRLGSNWTIGTLTAVTGRNEVEVFEKATGATSNLLVAPLTAYNVLRLKREFGSSGHIGLMATGSTTHETDGGYETDPTQNDPTMQQLCPSGAKTTPGARCFRDSYVTGVDGLWRSRSGDYVANGAIIESFIHGGPTITQLDGTNIGAGAHSTGGWARIAKEGGAHLLASATYSGAGRTLDYNDLGFMPRQNLHEATASIGYRTLEPGRFTLDTSSAVQVTERRSLSGLDLGQIYELNTRMRLRSYWTFFAAADLAPPHFDDREVGNGAALERGGYVGARLDLSSDPKRSVVMTFSGQAQRIQNDADAYTAQGSLTLSPVPQFNVSLAPQITWSAGEQRYTAETVPSSPTDPNTLDYVFGKLQAVSVGATLRVNYTFAPRLSLQTYAQAFLASGHFADLRLNAAIGGQKIRISDLEAAPPGTSLATNPDFEEAALNLNVVFRWEYRLGSTLFLVYSRSQVPDLGILMTPATLQPRALGTRASADVILLKLSYWWSS